jgi:hypothetical protein
MLGAARFPVLAPALQEVRNALAAPAAKPADRSPVVARYVQQARDLIGSPYPAIDPQLPLPLRVNLGELLDWLGTWLRFKWWCEDPAERDKALLFLDEVLGAMTKTRKKRGAPVKWPKALEMALDLHGKGQKDRVIHRLCREKYGNEEKIPAELKSFMRTILRHAAKKHG